MGKRRSRSQQLVVTPDSSKAGTPAATDSDASDHTPPRKKHKDEKKGSSGPKSSEELCKQFGLVHVSLEYTEADYQNLTNYGLFVRMVRPQVQEANPTISSSKMAQLMEAKWREFREGNPLTKKRREEEEKRRAEETKKDKKKDDKKKEKPKQAEEPRRRGKEHVVDSEPDEDELGEDDEEDDDEETEVSEVEEEEEEEVVVAPRSSKRRSAGLMRVRLPLPKSAKKKKAVQYDSEEESTSKKTRSRRSRSSRIQSEEEASEEEPTRRSGRTVRKKKMADYAEEISEDDDSDPVPKKKKRKKPQEASDDEFEGSAESVSDEEPEEEEEDEDMDGEEEEDSDVDERRRKKQKKKKKSSKKDDKFTHAIPGERKSARKSAGLGEGAKGFLTDREFEKMIAHDTEYDKKKAKKNKKKAEITKRKEANESKKKAFFEKQERIKGGEKIEEDSGDESDHCFYCELCHDAGDLLLCDKCPRSWHQSCLKLEKIPEGEWLCPKCTGDMESEEEDTGHETFCRLCKDGGDVILCDTCPCVFHLHCVNPPISEVPEGEWKCPRCMTLETPLKGWVHSILTWKWSHHVKGHDELDHTHSPTKRMTEALKQEAAEAEEKTKEEQPRGKPIRMLFVRFRDYSYWECDWITELQLEMFHSPAWHNFHKKWDMNEPPALEDGSSFGKRRRHNSEADPDDPHNLEEKYYKWGVKPEWLQIDRIISHDKRKAYLVKWRELSYEDVSWELASHIHPAVEGWQAKVDKYWAHRKEHLKDDKRDRGPKPKKSLLKKKMETQPKYLDDTGCKLHPYQLEGLNWMRFSWAQDTNTILADEMGLGKTIQAITFLYGLWKEGYTKGPFLLSVPLSTLLNWEREFALWAPDMYVVTYIGGKECRRIIREHEFSYKEGAFAHYHKPCRFREGYRPKFDVLLTSYEFVSQDVTTLNSLEWSVLVIDEAHRLKSQQSLFFRVLSQYKLAYILLLTGTPLQNNLEELFNLLNFLEREKFADMETFLGSFTDISKEEQVAKLHEMLAPHMLRRLKIDVFKDLPSKTELIVRVELSSLQKKFYKHILTKNYEALNVRGHSNQTSLMNIMMDLRKCCNHPYLFPAAETEAPITKQGYFEGAALTKACGKLEILEKMLRELRKQNHRVLIFSQMTRVLDILEDFMMHMQFNYERIDGSVMGKLRQESIDRFNSPNSDSFVFLLSTKAGGLGINLATADTVIIYDMDWNPHNDIQAFSRAHRIGQKNKVMIYRFVCRNTVEERMTQVCKQKMMLTELVIHRGMTNVAKKEKTESISKQEVNDILKFGAEKLFRDEEEGKVVYDNETIKKLLDRNQDHDNKKEKEGEDPAFGMNDYLRSFKVATYNVKEVAEEEEEEEKEKEEEEVAEETSKDDDSEYWQRILGSAFEEHQLQLLREQEELAAQLGKGKRVRRKVNYAEALQEQKKAKEERMRQKELREREHTEGMDDDEEDREDVLYMSDYEPASSEHSEESSDNQDDGVEEPALEAVSRKKLLRMSKQERYKVRQQQKELKEKESSRPGEREKMPPLLAKVNGQIEVLGFTPRQRRAFMDAIMRYGLPLEEVYKSQWLVRDLRRKPEKVFKAYVSLFLRHLCEPINEDSEKFADGTPREGLSRQHVLTRIGMMSLIRRKVNEFEKDNGTDSFQDFGIQIVIGGSKAELSMADKDKDKDKDKDGEKEKDGEKSVEKDSSEKDNEKSGEKSSEKEKSGSEKEKSPEKEKSGSEKEKSPETEKETSDGKLAEVKTEEDKDKVSNEEEEKSKEGDKEEKDTEKENVKEGEVKEGEKIKEEVIEKEKVIEEEKVKEEETAKGEEVNEKEKVIDGDKVKEEEKTEERSDETAEKEKGKPEDKDEETGEVEKKGESNDKEEEEAKAAEKTGDVKEEKDKEGESKESEDKDGEKEAMEVDPEKETDKKDADKEKGSTSKDEKEMDVDCKNESEKGDESKESQEKEDKAEKKGEKVEEKEKDVKEGSKKDENPKDNGKKKNEGVKDKKAEKDDDVLVVATSKKAKSSVDRAIEERVTRQRRLRKKFYIADGGFTDLQNLWNYEENLIKDQKEYEVWHRHHDFWLLTGIVTHGYRHWQDILNDPRYEVLNRAFRNDSDKMRKGAFLNRRFQLLEQALVIEEQLRRELRENKSLLKLLPTPKTSEDDVFTQIDQLAEVLRKLIKDGHIPAGTDPVLIKILMQIENLVGDIRQATYTGMPSTIAKSPAQLAARMQNISSPSPSSYPRGTVAAQLQQQQAAYQRQQQQQKARILSKPMTPMQQKKKGGIITID